MRLSLGLLLPALAGVAHAASPPVDGYILSASKPKTAETVAVNSEQLRLVLAQQIGVSKYHNLHDANSLDIINSLSIPQQHAPTLFGDLSDGQPKRLLIAFTGTDQELKDIKNEWLGDSVAPSFTLEDLKPPGVKDYEALLRDMQTQARQAAHCRNQVTLGKMDNWDEIFDCWDDKTEAVVITHQASLAEHDYLATAAKTKVLSAIEAREIDTTLLFIPCSLDSFSCSAFGSYAMPTTKKLHGKRTPESERIMSASNIGIKHHDYTTFNTPSSRSGEEQVTVNRKFPALCHASLEVCTNATNSCSGHGECYKKYGPADGESGAACYTCGCKPSSHSDGTGVVYWGGAACQKRDISSQFWLLASFSVLLMGLVGWAIGMMYSIGNEKLPGVIGAGVAPKTR